ncbi:MAG: hypothetical protein O2983_16315, partial [Planctomycetota bacterium]|nr:hypothetical protein [Planctomycetota bacterium]
MTDPKCDYCDEILIDDWETCSGCGIERCSHCSFGIPPDWTYCPHCGKLPSIPNVVTARKKEQVDELEKRYKAAVREARSNSAESALKALEATLDQSQAVLACSLSKLARLVAESDIFANYYHLESLKFLSRNDDPDAPDWSRLRPQTEVELLGNDKHYQKLHYACLTTNGESLTHYGECSVVLSEKMTAHRSTVFQENSALLFHRIKESGSVPKGRKKSGKKKIRPGFPPGIMSTWQNRAKLGVAKLAKQLTSSTQSSEFPELVLKPGNSGLDDEFIEVHVFG